MNVRLHVYPLCGGWAGDRDSGYPVNGYQVAQEKGLRCVNGYTGNSPWVYDKFWRQPNEAHRVDWFKHKKFTEKVVVITPRE